MSSFEDALGRFRSTPLTSRQGSVNREGPVLRGRPGAITALQNRDRDPQFQRLLETFNDETRATLADLDRRRINRGQMPYTDREVALGGTAATTREAQTPTNDRGSSITSIPANAVRDIMQMAKGLPHMPRAIADEIRDFTDGFSDDRRELEQQGRTGLAQTLSLPGIRMIPGAYLASNVLAGDTDELIQHPLLNALDVLPWASKAAKGTQVFKTADANAIASRALGHPTPRPRPLPTVMTRRLNEAGDAVTRNRFGQAIDATMQHQPFATVSDNFGRLSRGAMRHLHGGEAEAAARVNHPRADDRVGQIVHEWEQLAASDSRLMDRYGITRAREAELTRIAQVDTPAQALLPDNELRYITDYRARVEELAEIKAAVTGELQKIDGEWFTLKDAQTLRSVNERHMRALGEVYGSQEWTTRMRRTKRGRVEERSFDDGIMGAVDKLADSDPRGLWSRVKAHLDGGDVTAAARLLDGEGANIPAAARQVNRMRNYGAKAAGLTDQQVFKVRSTINKAALAEKRVVNTRARINPARFDELINARAGDQYLNTLLERGAFTADDLPKVQRFMQEGVLEGVPGFNRREWAKVRHGVRSTWQKLKDEGHDPAFVSRVTPDQVKRLTNVKLDGSIKSLSTARKRVSDVTPSVQSLSISVTREGFDVIRREAAEGAARSVLDDWGRSHLELRDEFLPMAEELAKRRPNVPLGSLLEDLIRRRYSPFDPNSMMPFAGGVSGLPTERIFIPRQIATVLKQANQEGWTKLRAINDPITRTWRVALLPLAPRWHLYNIVGGAVMVSVKTGPQALLRMRDAYKIRKAVREGTELPRSIPRELERTIGIVGREEAELALKRGVTMDRLLNEQAALGKASRMGRMFIEKSYALNSWFDDLYRVSAYLDGEAGALRRFKKMGFDDDAARTAAAREGVETSRAILQDIAGMTPLERSVFRQVFPFYSWLSHLMRFAFNFPMDHPWRAAIVAGGSRIVMEDFGSAASIDMLDTFEWGEPDENGKRRALRMRGMNPFSDTANLFTLAGWLGNTNPLFQTALESIGIDPREGTADLHPTLRYNPETGGLSVDTGNPLRNLTLNSIPHVATLTKYLGMDADFNELRRNDPATAERMLWGGIGAPVSYTRTSRSADYIRAEHARMRDATTRRNTALSTGNLDALEPFMGAEAVAALKKARESGELDQYLQETPG